MSHKFQYGEEEIEVTASMHLPGGESLYFVGGRPTDQSFAWEGETFKGTLNITTMWQEIRETATRTNTPPEGVEAIFINTMPENMAFVSETVDVDRDRVEQYKRDIKRVYDTKVMLLLEVGDKHIPVDGNNAAVALSESGYPQMKAFTLAPSFYERFLVRLFHHKKDGTVVEVDMSKNVRSHFGTYGKPGDVVVLTPDGREIPQEW